MLKLRNIQYTLLALAIHILASSNLYASPDGGRMMQSLGVFFHNTGLNIQTTLDRSTLDKKISEHELGANSSQLMGLYFNRSVLQQYSKKDYRFDLLKAIQAKVHTGRVGVNDPMIDSVKSFLMDGCIPKHCKSYINYIISKAYYFDGNYRDGIKYIRSAYKLLDDQRRVNDSLYIVYSSLAFSTLFYLQDYISAKEILQEALTKHVFSFGHEETYMLAALHNNLGIVERKFGNYSLALQHYDNSLKIKMKLGLDNPDKIILSTNNLGSLYCTIGNYEKALQVVSECEAKFPNKGSIKTRNSTYLLKSKIYRYLGDFDKALQYIDLALISIQKSDEVLYSKLIEIYTHLGIIYFQSSQYEKALDAFNMAAEADRQAGSYREISNAFNLARLHSVMNNFELAEKYYKQIIINKEKRLSDSQKRGFINTYLLYGEVLSKQNRFEEAEKLIKEALSIAINVDGPFYHTTGWCYEYLGDLYIQKDLDQSKRLFDDAIRVLSKDVALTDHALLPPISELSSFQSLELFRIIKKKTVALEARLEENRSFENLKETQEHFAYLVGLIEKSRSLKLSNSSKLEFSEDNQEIFDKALRYSLELYRSTGDMAFAESAFSVAERSKAGLLYEQIRENEARQFADIPDSLLQQESDLRREIASIQNLIYEEHKENNPDSLKLSNWEARLLRMQSKQDQLTLNFEKFYPDYYQFKYENKLYGLSDIRNRMGQNEALVEYYLSDNWLVSFCITSEGIRIIDQTLDTPLEEYLAYLPNRHELSTIVSNPEKVYNDYTASAYELYNILLQPLASEIKNRKLVIVPDGQLGYISFESLLSKPSKSKKVDYSSLAYVIRDHSISYGYSASLLIKAIDRPSGNPKGDLLAFAPAIFDPTQPMDGNHMRFVTRSGELMNLPQTLNEVSSIGKILRGKILMQEDATESMFKSLAESYRILHIATHGLVDDDQPMYSKLAFYQNAEDGEDDYLNTYELFNMKLNAELAVLSACNTGYGKHVEGEGLMTLARGFMYSGVPSLVISLWKVEDRSTAAIMELFYGYLKEGMSKDEALRQAKLDYLSGAKSLAASPYFWSSFVNIGDPEPIEFQPFNMAYLTIGPVLIILMLSLVYLRRRVKVPGILL